MKSMFHGNNRFNITEEKVGEFEDIAIETMKNKTERKS
jgi:hypothetical protein